MLLPAEYTTSKTHGKEQNVSRIEEDRATDDGISSDEEPWMPVISE